MLFTRRSPETRLSQRSSAEVSREVLDAELNGILTVSTLMISLAFAIVGSIDREETKGLWDDPNNWIVKDVPSGKYQIADLEDWMLTPTHLGAMIYAFVISIVIMNCSTEQHFALRSSASRLKVAEWSHNLFSRHQP